MSSTLLNNCKIVLPSKVTEGSLFLKNNRIETISENKFLTIDAAETIDCNGKYVLPGFIDIHTNGNAGFDFSNGLYNNHTKSFSNSKADYFNGLNEATNSYLRNGVTSVLISSITTSIEKLKTNLSYFAEWKNENKGNIISKIIDGIYIEGNFIKDKKYAGAHNHSHFIKPSRILIDELISLSNNSIKVINVDPAWGREANEIIRYLNDNKIITGIGHTGANADQSKDAIANGSKLVTHFFNGPIFSSYKPFNNGGATEEILKNDNLFIEVIADGIHVDKAYVLDLIKRKPENKMIAITDNMFTTNSFVENEFYLDGIKGLISEDKSHLLVADKENALFGSNITMDKVFNNLVNWFTSDIEGIWNKQLKAISFDDALVKAVQLCSTNPAAALNYYYDNSIGSVEVGKVADLILADVKLETNSCTTKICKVIKSGKMVSF